MANKKLRMKKAYHHDGDDYTVVMLGSEHTDAASIVVKGSKADRTAIGKRIQELWNQARLAERLDSGEPAKLAGTATVTITSVDGPRAIDRRPPRNRKFQIDLGDPANGFK